MISIDDMMVFTKVVEAQSFTRAAQELGLGKARVSQIISQLEQKLQTRLLNRTTRSLSLTDSGGHYYEKCCMIQDLANQANTQAKNISHEPSGPMRISMPCGNTALIGLLSEFIGLYPQIELDIIESDSCINLIKSRCDIAIRASSALEDSRLHAVKIGEFKDVICASPKYLARFDKLNSAKDLLRLSWVSHEIAQGSKQLMFTSSNREVVKLNQVPKVLVRTTHALRGFLLNQVGFGMIPDFAVKDELANGRLVRILPQLHDLTIALYVVYQEKALMPLSTRVLIDFLKQAAVPLFSVKK